MLCKLGATGPNVWNVIDDGILYYSTKFYGIQIRGFWDTSFWSLEIYMILISPVANLKQICHTHTHKHFISLYWGRPGNWMCLSCFHWWLWGCFGWLVNICVGLWGTLWRMCGALGMWSGMWPLGFQGGWGVRYLFLLLSALAFWLGLGIWLLGGVWRGAVWGDIACGAGCGPLKLEGWSKIEHSFVGVWPWHDFLAAWFWGLVARPACGVISGGFLFCIPRDLCFHFLGVEVRAEVAFFLITVVGFATFQCILEYHYKTYL